MANNTGRTRKRNREASMELAGRIWGIVGTLLDTALRILLIVAIVYVIYQGALKCYDYGYRIFTEEPISASVGHEVTVSIPADFSAKELGELFEDNGLARDKWLVVLQYYCSEFREDIAGGTYTFNTTMTVDEMFESIAEITIAKKEAREEEEDLLTIDEPSDDLGSEDGDYAEEDTEDSGTEETDSDGTEEEDSSGIQEIDGNGDDLLEDDIR